MKQRDQQIFIITGAAGHLGGAVTEALDRRGEAVYALCLPGEMHPPQGAHVKVYSGDVCEMSSLEGMFEDCADVDVTVIHCAGIVSISSKFDKKVYDVNVNGTKNIISLCEKHNVRKLVHISSVHAIPELPRGETIKEVYHFSPDEVVGLYAKTKAEASQCVLDYIGRGYDANIVHPSGIVGPGDLGKGHITQLVIDYCRGALAIGIDGGYDFVDVRDVADGVISCCDKGQSGECFILSGHYFKVRDLLSLLYEITGKREIKAVLPLWLAKMTAPLSEVYYRILKQPPLFTAYSIFTLNTNADFSSGKAAKELGYAARPMRQTLEDTIEWLGDNGRL